MIGKVPNGWRVEKLENLCDVSTGKKDANHGVENGQYLFFTCAAKPIKSNTYSFEGKSIILAGNGANVGLALYYDGKFEAYQRTYILNNFTENSRYIFYNLKRYWIVHNESKQFGSATNYIKMDNITKYPILIPPLQKQEKIVKVLDISSALIEKQKELIAKYDLFLKSKFIEMFGDPIKNPMGWKIEKLDKFTTLVSSGSTPKGGQSSYLDEGEIRFIRSQNVRMNEMDYDGIYYISEEVYTKMKRSQVKFNDVLLNITGASIGRTAIYKDTTRANVNQHVCIIRLTEQLNNEYLSFMISTDSFQNQIISNQSGATREALNYTQIKKFNIPYPPILLQNKFASIVEKTEKIKEQEVKKLEHLEVLHNSLMDKAFKGKVS
ncbi:restriction endonuclease subunit S [Candidatus Sulfurimonas baltica]|uniref:Restriction endonuclease subunit S n=1 Tax=Candidatus Sulfurimonas baltica TaxID=2740404 RepID=A0A7S7LY42_9BACT|nr:restriction endonuclease subunit S [Candidatus Sulfurimonas baltica]QOY52729.1 restriction endonuclease subunit S [Candidatus Sulfurimonas baltica]